MKRLFSLLLNCSFLLGVFAPLSSSAALEAESVNTYVPPEPASALVKERPGSLLEAVEVGEVTPIEEAAVAVAAPGETGPTSLQRAVREGSFPAQVAGHTGALRPDRYGPKRHDPTQGIPDHAYSPFDEWNNREHPCPPGGCEVAEGQVLVKLAPNIEVRSGAQAGAVAGEPALSKMLSVPGVERLEPIFPAAQRPSVGALVVTPEGDLIAKPDLTRWHRAVLSADQDVYQATEALAADPAVDYAEPDYLRKPVGRLAGFPPRLGSPGTLPLRPSAPTALPGPSTDPLYTDQWHLDATNVPAAWQWLEDNGYAAGGNRDIVVAVIDTGVDYDHPDLAANVWINPPEFTGDPGVDDDGNGYVDDVYGADTVYPDGDPRDDHGHGTHVAGIIAAQGNNNEGGVGVAPNVQIMTLKAAQYSGVLASSDIAEAITYAVDKGADVINMSFGGYARSQVEEDALAVAFGQAVLVAAAGNDGKVNLPCPLGRDMYPAAYNWVLGVMASTQSDTRAGFSNYDCAPHDSHEYELMAPGVDVWSTLPYEQYAAWDGTSMAAPVVSGIAVLARTRWAEKDVYSSRFIMGQIASNSSGGAGGVADAHAALTVAPEPELSYLEHWLFDTEAQSPENDDDGIVDAGETIDLAIVIRNHWGKAEPVTVTLEAWAEGAVQPDPYVTMITDTVSYGAVGSFNIDDNGLIYEDDVVTGVEHPFRFTVPITTPNDHLIPFRLTMEAGNGYDTDDPGAPYVFESRFYLIVQRGQELPRIIDEDMTLTQDYYYLIPDATLIEEGVTVTVTEGTQVQFWSADPDDPLSQEARPYVQVEGNLFVRGTAEQPVELFSGSLYPGHAVDIRSAGDGMSNSTGGTELRHTRVFNPRIWASEIDHCYFAQELLRCIYYRQGDEPWVDCTGPDVNAKVIRDTIFAEVGNDYRELSVERGSGNLYDSSRMRVQGGHLEDCVFLKNYKLYETQWDDREYWVSEAQGAGYRIYPPAFLRTAFPAQYDGKTYVALQTPYSVSHSDYLELAEFFANQFGGHVVAVNDAAENEFLRTYVERNLNETNFAQTYPELDCGTLECWDLFGDGRLTLGLSDRQAEGQFEWVNGEPTSYVNWETGEPDDGGSPASTEDYVTLVTWDAGRWHDTWGIDGPVALELPGTVSQEALDRMAVALQPKSSSSPAPGDRAMILRSTQRVTPFLDLPITYGRPGLAPAQGFAGALQGNVYGQGAGRVNAWFDHAAPNYSGDDQLVLWTGTYVTETLANIRRQSCTVGTGCYDGHNGVDFSAERANEPVFPSATGTVVSTSVGCDMGEGCGDRYGNHVWIDHGNGYATLYGHLEVVSVTVGTLVDDTDQPLGTMGATGDAWGTHLHFGVYFDQNGDGTWTENEAVDPFGWVGSGTDPWPMPNDYLWIHPLHTQTTYEPGTEATLVSPSGQITVTVPTGRFTSTLDLQLWETPLPIDTAHSQGYSNYRSLGRTFWLTRGSGIGAMDGSFQIQVSLTATSTRHLQDHAALLRPREDNGRWDYVDGNDIVDGSWSHSSSYGLNRYDLRAEVDCDDAEPNDTYYDARAVASDNTPVRWNRFDREHDRDWFRFQAVEGERYLIRTSNLTGGADTYLEVFNQDGFTLLAADDDGGEGDASTLQWEAPADGVYFIRITPAPDSTHDCADFSQYDLHVNWLAEGVQAALEAKRQQLIADGSFSELRNNAFLNVWWDPNVDHWMQFDVQAGRGYRRYINYNYWGTTNTTLIDAAIDDYNDDFNKGLYVYEPILTEAPESAYPFVTDVMLSTDMQTDTAEVGAETVTFTVSFNRDMDTTVPPAISFGPDVPETDYTVHAIDGGWRDPRTWIGSFDITPVTGDGYQFMRIAGAVAADDPWLVTGDDTERFRFEIVTSGTEAMNLQATGGEGYVDLMWTQDDFDLLSGFNLYRSTSISGTFTRINESIIPPDVRTYRDTDVQPGQPYYFKFTVVKSDMSESDFSNVASATPVDTVPPVIDHAPVTDAASGLPLTLHADVTDNVAVRDVSLFYRALGGATYLSKTMVNTTGDRYAATIEGSLVNSPGLEYYIEANDGVSTVRDGRPEYPHQVTVEDSPVVTVVSPARGPTSGGTGVTISGSNFKPGASVTFGSSVAEDAAVVSSSQITCTTPRHFPSAVDVTVTNPDGQSGTLLNGFTYESEVASLSLPDTGGGQHDIVEVPVNAANVDGLAAASFTVTFDSGVVGGHGASTGNLTSGWSIAANTETPGQIRVSMASPGGTASGSGVLTTLSFEVVGGPGDTTVVDLESVSLNDGAIPADTSAGSFTVEMVYDVSGTVHFWHDSVGVPDVDLMLEGDRVYNGVTGADGTYTVTGAEADDYTLTPEKASDTVGISAYDASLVLQHDAGLTPLSGHAATAADVNKSDGITSMDAFYILQKAVDLIALPFPGAGVVWDFDPAERVYSDLSADQTGQDFSGILLGDVSGNWSPAAMQRLSQRWEEPVVLRVDTGWADASGLATARIYVEPGSAEVYGLDLALAYDPHAATAVEVELGQAADGWMLASDLDRPGEALLALAGAVPIADGGELLTVRFQMTGLGSDRQLTIARGEANEGSVPTKMLHGELGVGRLHLPVVGRAERGD